MREITPTLKQLPDAASVSTAAAWAHEAAAVGGEQQDGDTAGSSRISSANRALTETLIRNTRLGTFWEAGSKWGLDQDPAATAYVWFNGLCRGDVRPHLDRELPDWGTCTRARDSATAVLRNTDSTHTACPLQCPYQ